VRHNKAVRVVKVVYFLALHVFGDNMSHVFIIADVATYFEANAVGLCVNGNCCRKMDSLIV